MPALPGIHMRMTLKGQSGAMNKAQGMMALGFLVARLAGLYSRRIT